MLSLEEIADLEINYMQEEAIAALEERLLAMPNDCDTVARLGFNLWYLVEDCRGGARGAEAMSDPHIEPYAQRFVALYKQYQLDCRAHPEFCWAFGLGISLFWYFFSGVSEADGQALLTRAMAADPFWRQVYNGTISQALLREHLSGKGIFARYYAVT